MKITQSNDKITAFGGFNFCHDIFQKSGIPNLIDEHLGQRVKYTGFNYSDIFTNHLAIFLNGGDCTEDVNEHLRSSLQQIPEMNVCSADTILRGVKELATHTIQYVSPSKITHQFNINTALNELLLKSLKLTKQLKPKEKYLLDYDNQVVATEKHDAKMTYKKCKGYQSGVASIGKLIVSVEGRNGNSPASYKQEETLKRTFSLLESENITISQFRADCASYQKGIIDLVSEKECLFYIRAKKCLSLSQQIGALQAEAWTKVRLGTQEMELAEITNYCPFHEDKPYRLVVSRIKRTDRQIDMETGTAHTYRSIITNDTVLTNSEITSLYNQRGASECTFDAMNNDFGWGKLPCSFLNENTSFMIMTALYSNFYQYMITLISQKVEWVKSNFRLKKFIFRFITVPAKWVKTGRQRILKLYTQKDYSALSTRA